MILYYCRSCWIYVSTEYAKDDNGKAVIDKTSKMCDDCTKDSRVHHNTAKVLCKRGHTIDAVHSVKGVKSRYCKICARMAEQRHRDRNPGYHDKYHKKKEKDAT